MSFKTFLSFGEDYRYFVAFNDCLYDEYLVEGRRRVAVPEFARDNADDYQDYHYERQQAPWANRKWKDWFGKNPKIDKSDIAKPGEMGDGGKIQGVNHDVLASKLGEAKAFDSYVVHLTPAAQSGFITCACASDGCRSTCLQTAGNIGALADKTHARLKKTWFLAKEMPHVIKNLISYIEKLNAKTEAEGNKLVLRLNGTSDIHWEDMTDDQGRSIPEVFPNVTFYDYTKVAKRMGKQLPNYHLTFSRSESNEPQALQMLEKGHNVAVVFGPGKVHNREELVYPKGTTRAGQPLLPVVWHGYRVINGDAHDLRFLEEQPKGQPGLVIGLVAKGAASFEHYDRTNAPEGSHGQFVMPTKPSFVVMPNDRGITAYSDNAEYIQATHDIINRRNASKQNTSGQFAGAKQKYNDEQELITGMLAGTLNPEQEAKAMESPQYKKLKGAISKIRDYCKKFPTACSRDYLAQASKALLKPTEDPTGEKRLPAMPFSMDTLKDIGLVTGRRSGATEQPDAQATEFRAWLRQRQGLPPEEPAPTQQPPQQQKPGTLSLPVVKS